MLEEKISELEKLVAELEKENVGIEEGIKLFEQGLKITKVCLDSLGESKGKITQLKVQMDKLLEEPAGTE